MEADGRQVTTVFTVQPSFHHRHSTNRALPSSANDEVRCVTAHSRTTVSLHDIRFVECRWWNDGLDCENCRHLTVVGLHDTGPRLMAGQATVYTNFKQPMQLDQRLRDVCFCCLTSQQQASVSQGRICSDYYTCCHTEIEVADPTFYLTQSQYTDTGPTSSSADPITPGAWQGSHWSANF